MKQRNPEATCETCPYLHIHKFAGRTFLECRAKPGITQEPFVSDDFHEHAFWCGEHPEFFLEEEKPVWRAEKPKRFPDPPDQQGARPL